ncbi:MAG: alpha/beta fold hydrolase [Micrococcaceae bacterium]
MTYEENANIKIDHSPLFRNGIGDKKNIGVVLCHGFTGSPHSMRPWAKHLMAQGYTVSMPLLPGHGTRWEDLGNTNWHSWVREVKNQVYSINDKCNTTIIIGLSMGGALALKMASEDLVDAAVVVNPGTIIDDPRRFATGVMQYLQDSLPAIGNDIKKPGVVEGAYPRVSVKATHQLKKLFHEVRKSLKDVEVPVLLFRSRKDHVVTDKNIGIIKKKIKPQYLRIIPLYNSYHVATLDYDAEDIFIKTDEFIEKIASGEHKHTVT